MTKAAQILLVEDNRMDAELAISAFHGAGLGKIIHVAPNGEEALDYLFGRQQYADRQTYPCPNLVLLDLNMPGMDGFEVLRQVKSAPATQRIPVIILTSVNEECDRAQAYDCGANGYFVKPSTFEGLKTLVQQITGHWLKFSAGSA